MVYFIDVTFLKNEIGKFQTVVLNETLRFLKVKGSFSQTSNKLQSISFHTNIISLLNFVSKSEILFNLNYLQKKKFQSLQNN